VADPRIPPRPRRKERGRLRAGLPRADAGSLCGIGDQVRGPDEHRSGQAWADGLGGTGQPERGQDPARPDRILDGGHDAESRPTARAGQHVERERPPHEGRPRPVAPRARPARLAWRRAVGGGPSVPLSGAVRTLKRGDVFRHEQPGPGGWGDPLERESRRVLWDVRNQFVSLLAAREEYGVVIDAETITVDETGTARVRAELRAARGWTETPKVLR
jgi:hypothetical protein